MIFSRVLRFAFCSIFLIMAVTNYPVLADSFSYKTLEKDFKPITGMIVGNYKSEYLIDLDSSHGISIGNIFAVTRKKEKIMHPETKKVLGILDKKVGFIRITRIKDGYSFAEAIDNNDETIAMGDIISRFTDMETVFWDYTGNSEDFFSSVTKTLPGLSWIDFRKAQELKPQSPDYTSTGKPRIFFILTGQRLEIRDPDFRLLESYSGNFMSSSAQGRKKTADDAAPSIQYNKDAIDYKNPYKGYQLLGTFNESITISDFIRFENRKLIATTDSRRVSIYSFEQSLKKISEIKNPGLGKILDLNWWCPKENGQLFLAVTYWLHDKINSDIYKLENTNLTPEVKNLPYFSGTFDMNDNGVPETLMVQNFDREKFWGNTIRSAFFDNGNIQYRKSSLELPGLFCVGGSLMSDIDRDGNVEAIFVRKRRLYVYKGKKLVYKSAKAVGGGLSSIEYKAMNSDVLTRDLVGTVELSPIAVNLDQNDNMEIVTVTAELSGISFGNIGSKIKSCQLTVFSQSGNTFLQGSWGDVIKSPLSGLAFDGSRVIFIASQKESLFGSNGKSHLLGFPSQ